MNSYTSQNVLLKQKERFGHQEETSIRTSNESNVYWGENFQKNPFFRIYSDLKNGLNVDYCSVGIKTTNLYKQNPV